MKNINKNYLSFVSEQAKCISKRFAYQIDRFPEKRRLTINAKAVSPLVTGMGIDHPLENGFAFLNPYGLPYLPGSSVKGVLRKSWCDLYDKEFVAELFGDIDNKDNRRGALKFWDCIPDMGSRHMEQDIMTPHYSKYLEGKESPHDAETPTPILFLTIPPDSEFSFHSTIDESLLQDKGLKNGEWKPRLKNAYCHAFEWIGFGAKTSVGYGSMMRKEGDPPPGNGGPDTGNVTKFQRLINDIISSGPKDQEDYIIVFNDFHQLGFDRNGFDADELKREVAQYLKGEMQKNNDWKEKGNPNKDKKHKRTLRVMGWLN